MFNSKNLNQILFIDIETVASQPSFDLLDSVLQKEWQKKYDRLQNTTNTHKSIAEAYSDSAAIYAEFAKIIVISIAKIEIKEEQTFLKIKTLSNDDEAALLNQFNKIILANNKLKYICGHNIKEFDVPFICRRLLINNLTLPPLFNISGKKSYELDFLLDTLQYWKFGDFKHYTSLQLLTSIFGITSSKSSMDGSKVGAAYWQEQNLKDIADYCAEDVVAVTNLFLKLNQLPIIDEKNITYT